MVWTIGFACPVVQRNIFIFEHHRFAGAIRTNDCYQNDPAENIRKKGRLVGSVYRPVEVVSFCSSLSGDYRTGTATPMSARMLIDAICDLNLPPMRATDDEISALRADPDLGDWYEYADCIWSANEIAESLLVTYRNLKNGRCSMPVSKAPEVRQGTDLREWWSWCEDILNQHFAYWAATLFLAGMAVGAFR